MDIDLKKIRAASFMLDSDTNLIPAKRRWIFGSQHVIDFLIQQKKSGAPAKVVIYWHGCLKGAAALATGDASTPTNAMSLIIASKTSSVSSLCLPAQSFTPPEKGVYSPLRQEG